ncbi:MAG: hypothetical protein JXB32_21865 [Deltaproteobacteria bacterium]|nr:hypothetical protein [Deltaproteobacteria bacterium]
MSGVDEIVARSRQAGTFVERRTFTVARDRAIAKLRKFTLASPFDYVLELIQAAVSNGAQYVDLDLHGSRMGLSYVGGGFAPDELGQLFDFLFASKEDLETADVRQLALGLNALFLFEPDEIVLESGDGTPQHTTRVRITGTDTLEVGRPDTPLRGTYVVARGLSGGGLGARSPRRGELSAIESRCLTAPVPIVVNSEPLFGYTRARTPKLFGYDRWVPFDEGDLYGAVGLGSTSDDRVFQLLTWGVRIEAVRAEPFPGLKLGGIVCFDRLHKTVDHAAIVRDERLDELFARLRPYAQMLRDGRATATYDLRLPDGPPLGPRALRDLAHRARTLVVVRAGACRDPRALQRARQLGAALSAPVLLAGETDASAVRLIAGPKVRVLEPCVETDTDLSFCLQPPAEPPQPPWLVAPLEGEPLAADRLADVLQADGVLPPLFHAGPEPRAHFLAELGARTAVRPTVFVPEQPPHPGGLAVELVSVDRLVAHLPLDSRFTGGLLRIEVDGASPGALLRRWPGTTDTTLASLVAYAVARLSASALETAERRVMAGLERSRATVGSTASRAAFGALARSGLLRLRTDAEGFVVPRFSLLDPQLPASLLDLPILRTLDGQERSARDLERLLEATGGVLYGTVPEVPADLAGLERSRILELDAQRERLLIALVGEASYVRVDARDLLAEHRGLQVRDFALGLRAWPDFPLLVEGIDPAALSPTDRTAAEHALLGRLVRTFATGSTEELRRQAARHLIWYLRRRTPSAPRLPHAPVVESLPLFLDVDGVPRSLDELRELLAGPGVPMHDGWSVDPADLGPLTAAATGGDPAASRPPLRGLAMNPFARHVLSLLGRVNPVLDFDLSDPEALADPRPPETAYAVRVDVETDFATGVLGLPTLDVAEPAVAVVDEQQRRLGVLREVARDDGVVGVLRLRGADVPAERIEALARHGVTLLFDTLARRLSEPDADDPQRLRCLLAALRWAGRQTLFVARPDGSVALDVRDPVAERILDLPVFPAAGGLPVTARRLLAEHAAACSGMLPEDARTPLDPATPAPLRAWLDAARAGARVVRPAARQAAPQAETDVARSPRKLAAWLVELLTNLGATAGRTHPLVVQLGPSVPGRWGPGRKGRRDELVVACLPVGTQEGPRQLIVLDASHPLVVRLLADPRGDLEALAWVLLACYGRLNEALATVSDADELAFQHRVLDLLEAPIREP